MNNHTILLSIAIGLLASVVQAAPAGLTYQGRLVKNNLPVEANPVTLTVKVTSPGVNECVLYEEAHTLNMTNSDGIFSVKIGGGTRTVNDEALSMVQVFSNTNSIMNGLVCGGGATSYTSVSADSRNIYATFNDGVDTVAFSSPYVIQSVPYALEAERLEGKTASEFLQTTADTTQSKINALTAVGPYAELLALINGTSTQYMTPSSTISTSGTFSQSYTGTGTASTITANSVTTSAVQSITGNGLTSGSLLSLSSNSTAAAAGNKGLDVAISGANSTVSVTRTGISSVVNSTGTSSTNVAGYFSATGATNNYGLIVASGNVGIGTTSPGLALDVVGDMRSTNNVWTSTLRTNTVATNGTADLLLRNTGARDIIFQTDGSTERLRIVNTTGNIGIGTQTPTANLDVVGTSQLGNVGPTSATTFSAAALSTDTTLSVVSTTGYPSSGNLYLSDGTTNLESVSYTGKTATTFTGVTRALYGTSARAWSIGHTVDLVTNIIAGANNTTAPRVYYTQTRGMGYGMVPSAWNVNGSQYSGVLYTQSGMQISAAGGGLNFGTSSTNILGQGTTATTDFVRIVTNNSEKLRVDGIGRVGINNFSPRGILDVNRIANTRLSSSINSSVTTMTVAANSFPASGILIIGSEQMTYTGGGTTTLTVTRAANSTTAASHSANTPISYYGPSDFILTSNGNVGIGTSAPSFPLEVYGNVRLRNNLTTGSSDTVEYLSDSASTIRPGTSGNSNINIMNATTGMDGAGAYLNFNTLNAAGTNNWGYLGFISVPSSTSGAIVMGQRTGTSSYSERLRIDSSGNVGIGTTSPQATIDVNGYARLRSYSSAPVTCAAGNAGAIALTSNYTGCVCNGTSWIKLADATACVW